MKGKICAFKNKPPKKYQVGKCFIYKKQVFINWFVQTQFLVIRKSEWWNVGFIKINFF